MGQNLPILYDPTVWLTLAAMVVGGVLVRHARRAPAIFSREWLCESRPRTGGTAQGVALLLSLLLTSIAFAYSLAANRGRAPAPREFEVLGFNFSHGTAICVLSLTFTLTTFALAVVSARGADADGLVGELIAHRAVRMPLLGLIGWVFSYIVGHAWVRAQTGLDHDVRRITECASALLIAVTFGAAAVKRRNVLTAFIGVAGTMGGAFVALAEPHNVSNLALAPALGVVAVLLIDFFDSDAQGDSERSAAETAEAGGLLSATREGSS